MNKKQIHPVKSSEAGAKQFNRVKKVVSKNIKVAQTKGKAIIKKSVKNLSAQGASLLKKERKMVKKSVVMANAKSSELKAIAKSGYKQLKKDMNISPADAKKLEAKAIKEYEKVKKQMEVTAKKAETYMKKNPGKAALISAGIGAALAGAAALLLSSGDKKPAKRKK